MRFEIGFMGMPTPAVVISGPSSVHAVASATYTASGGTGSGYTWSITTTTNSTIDSVTGVYQAGDAIGNVDTIHVVDSGGHSASKSVTILAWFPELIYTPIAIYDGRRGITVGDGFFTWDDQTGVGDHGLTSSSPNELVITATDANYNNQTSISTSGTGTRLATSAVWASSVTQPFTMYYCGILSGGSICGDIAGGKAQFTFGGGDVNMNAGSSLDTTVGISRTIICGVFNGGTSSSYAGGNMNTPTASGAVGANGLTQFDLGDGVSSSFEITMALVYTGAHNSTQRNRIYTQMHALYGVT